MRIASIDDEIRSTNPPPSFSIMFRCSDHCVLTHKFIMHRSILATQFALPLPSPSTSRHRSERASWHRFLFEGCKPEGLSTAFIARTNKTVHSDRVANHAEVPSGLPIGFSTPPSGSLLE